MTDRRCTGLWAGELSLESNGEGLAGLLSRWYDSRWVAAGEAEGLSAACIRGPDTRKLCRMEEGRERGERHANSSPLAIAASPLATL